MDEPNLLARVPVVCRLDFKGCNITNSIWNTAARPTIENPPFDKVLPQLQTDHESAAGRLFLYVAPHSCSAAALLSLVDDHTTDNMLRLEQTPLSCCAAYMASMTELQCFATD
jgi:hypothetical protein